eukprot:TRINITY_DN1789_c0_g2_i1.p1 TRINITY_DN1789_c0_g2~~TRINITY_DN1789_c0_g2_i1.p1  ORF type:complete len:294 (+),score=23.39 TRINITY_DN1789_c0_g2_i1:66-947(+)
MSDCMNVKESCTTVFGWLLSISVWVHLIFMAVCEPDLDTDRAICDYYRTEFSSFTVRNSYFYVVLALSYIGYLVLACCMPARSYLSNELDVSADEYQKQLFNAPPTCWFHIECYHYTTSGTGKDRKRRKVVTKTKREVFQYASYSSYCAVGSEYSTAMRLRLSKNLRFADEQTKATYDAQLKQFVATHTSDSYQSVTTGIDIPGYHKYVLAFSDPANKPSGYSAALYYLSVPFTLSMPYATYIYWSTKPVDIAVTKEVSLFPVQVQGVVAGWTPTPTPAGKIVGPDYEQTEYV